MKKHAVQLLGTILVAGSLFVHAAPAGADDSSIHVQNLKAFSPVACSTQNWIIDGDVVPAGDSAAWQLTVRFEDPRGDPVWEAPGDTFWSSDGHPAAFTGSDDFCGKGALADVSGVYTIFAEVEVWDPDGSGQLIQDDTLYSHFTFTVPDRDKTGISVQIHRVAKKRYIVHAYLKRRSKRWATRGYVNLTIRQNGIWRSIDSNYTNRRGIYTRVFVVRAKNPNFAFRFYLEGNDLTYGSHSRGFRIHRGFPINLT